MKPWIIVALSVALCAAPMLAQQTSTPGVTFTATSANVTESGSPLKIHVIRWSTDAERTPVMAALNSAPPAIAPAGAVAGPPAGAEANPSAPAGDGGGAARGGRAGAGRGAGRGFGRGRAGRGGRGDAPPSPIAALTAALGRAPTLGYIWTNDVTGYSIKYAYHASLPDGGERIILATNRRLGVYTPAWTPAAAAPLGAEASAKAAPTDYEFTLIEIRLDAKGLGEGKTSLTTKVIVDNEAKSVALENYAATPAILRNVKR